MKDRIYTAAVAAVLILGAAGAGWLFLYIVGRLAILAGLY